MTIPLAAAVSKDNIVEVRTVSKQYRQHLALNALDLEVVRGETLALIGHNGAGKTTLLKLILGLTQPTDGTLRVRGYAPEHHSNRQTVAFLPEIVAFPGEMTGRELLHFYARLKQSPLRACDELLDTVGLVDAARRKVSTYSKGMRQRLGLAQALLGKPELILLDEPTSGLDPALRKHFYRIIDECKSQGATILISSHALSEIESRVNRIAILKQGEMVVAGTLEELRTKAQLAVQIRVTTQEGRTQLVSDRIKHAYPWRQFNNHCIEFDCSAQDKLSVLNDLSQISVGVTDIEIMPPNLDDLYMHFAGEEADA